MPSRDDDKLMTFGGHLEVLRRMLFRIIAVISIVAIIVFCFKKETWNILLFPSDADFCTYRWIEYIGNSIKHFFSPFTHDYTTFRLEVYHVDLISTELSSQFMIHITTAVCLGVLGASPYILYELFRFVLPALQEKERKYSTKVAATIYCLFLIGVLISYFIVFPISFRFLGTYNVSERIHSAITIDSYVYTFVSLTLLMGLVFQFPVIVFFLSKIGIVNENMLIRYRKHAFLLIMLVSAVITPPDLITLIIITFPLYLLYEISIKIVKVATNNKKI